MSKRYTSSAAAGSGSAGGPSAAGGANANNVSFCVNPVLFEHCGTLLEPSCGLTTTAVMKLRQEAGNATSLSLAHWKEMATPLLNLSESTAYTLFDVFFAASGGCIQGTPSYYGSFVSQQKPVSEFRQEVNRMLLNRMGGAVNEAEWPTASPNREVSLPGMMIFLIAQVLLDRPPRRSLGDVGQDLVVNNLRQYLHDYITAVAVTRQGRLTLADALELRILLREFCNGVEQPFGTSIGFLWPKNEKTIDIAILSQFIRPRIVFQNDVPVRNRTAQNINSSLSPFPNNITVQGLTDRVYISPTPVLDEAAARLLSSTYVVANCSQTTLYVASALPHTRLSNLTNCTVALGPVAGVLCIDRCQQCTISALCGTVVVSNSKNVNVFICSNTPPVLSFNGNPTSIQNVRFAPYNTHYSTLEEDLALSGISPKLNLWNAGLPSQQFILPPDEFTPICFPVSPQSHSVVTTRTNPCSLPEPYVEALNRRLQRFQQTSKQLQDTYAQLEEEGRKDLADSLRSRVHTLFVEWLSQSGQGAGLTELLHQPATK